MVKKIIQIIQCKIAGRGKELNTFLTTNKSDDLCLFFYLYTSFIWLKTTFRTLHFTVLKEPER